MKTSRPPLERVRGSGARIYTLLSDGEVQEGSTWEACSMAPVLGVDNLVAFRQTWKRFEEAVPGSVRLVPQAGLRKVIEQDYRAMQGMILGDGPDVRWVMDQLQHAEAVINGT